jgi:hypothetical protein
MNPHTQAWNTGNRSDTIDAKTDSNAQTNKQRSNRQMNPIKLTALDDDIPAERHPQCCNHDCNEGRDCPYRTAQGRTLSDHLSDAAVSAKHSLIQWMKRLNQSGL